MISAIRFLTQSALTSLPTRSLSEWRIVGSAAARPSWQMMDSNSTSLTFGGGAACANVGGLGLGSLANAISIHALF
jgi:hypothetical protein